MSFEATHSATSSPALGDGVSPCALPDGPTTDLFGQEAALASPSVRPGSSEERQTSATCGPTLFDLFGPVDPPPSSANKSADALASSGLMVKERTCRTCKTVLPYSEFYVNSKGSRRNSCKACVKAAERLRKRLEPEAVSERYATWRLEKRGYALVNVAKNRAKTRGLPFDLDASEIQAVIDAGRCQVTGIAFDLSEPRAWNAPSLDQIVPGAGYTKANVRVVLYALNVMANTWGTQRISQIASAISDRQRERSEHFSTLIAERLKQATTTHGSLLFDFSWKNVATPSGRSICALRASAHRTSGSGCTGWPTTQSRDGAHSRSGMPERTGGRRRNLDDYVTLAPWTTPAASDGQRGGTMTPNMTGSSLTQLASLSAWPTPTAHVIDAKKAPPIMQGRKATDPQIGLADVAVHLTGWQTPMSSDGQVTKGRSPEFLKGRTLVSPSEVLTLGPQSNGSPAATEKPGQLSPLFSAWLMGYPPEWCLAAPAKKEK